MSKNDYRFMSRAEIEEYLESRGFAVYDDESTKELREAVRLQMICEAYWTIL